MKGKRITAFLVMVIYLSALFTPISAYAADGAASAQAAVNALSMGAQGDSGGISLTPNNAAGGEDAADTGSGSDTNAPTFPTIGDEATTEPDVTVVKEKLDEEKIATTSAIDSTMTAPASLYCKSVYDMGKPAPRSTTTV